MNHSSSSVPEQRVSKFASLLGTKGALQNSKGPSISKSDQGNAVSRELLACLSRTIESHEVICTVPSLDMRTVDDETGSMPLPGVGEHRSTKISAPAGTNKGKPPQMAASVLNSGASKASASDVQVEQKAAQTLGELTSWTKSSVIYASSAICKNVADSFSSLVDSRVRAWTLLLLRHSLTSGDSASRSRLLSMLSSIIKVHSAETAFKTIALPQSAASQPKEADVILPLLLEVDLHISIQGKADMVTLRAPGTISAHFDQQRMNGDGTGLIRVDIRLDTGAMLDSMVQQARMIVFKAVAKATSATESMALDPKLAAASGVPAEDLAVVTSDVLSGGFNSALNITSTINEKEEMAQDPVKPAGPHEPGHRLMKARSSALKLNSVLHGAAGRSDGISALEKTRKMRSVQWDQRTDVLKVKPTGTPSPKRQRMADAKSLRSFKSFGRPHAGDFGSGPRNATFGDFGRKPIWGRDGKLANRPAPINPNAPTNDVFGEETPSRPSKNATFDFQRPSIHLSSGLNLGMTKSKKAHSTTPSPISGGGMTRSATAYENWLLAKTAGGKGR